MRKIYGFFGLIAICACTTLPLNLEKPKLSLQTVNLSDSNLSDTNVVFHFLVENPNTVAVAVDQLDYALKINGKSLTQGVLKEGLKVGAKSSSLIDLPVRVKYADLASSVSDFLSQGTSKYEINGAAKLGLFSIPFSEKGDLKISDLKQ